MFAVAIFEINLAIIQKLDIGTSSHDIIDITGDLKLQSFPIMQKQINNISFEIEKFK